MKIRDICEYLLVFSVLIVTFTYQRGEAQANFHEHENADVVEARHCPSTFEDWQPTSNFCYQIFVKKLNWTKAESKCGQYGGNLISISSSTLTNIVTSRMKNKELGHLWIGLTKEGDDTWEWNDGTKFIYHNWARAEERSSLHSSDHDHTINKDCVSISDGTGFWYDHTLCSQPLRFICQVCANGKAAPDCTHAQGLHQMNSGNVLGFNASTIAVILLSIIVNHSRKY